jgi:deoxyribose-phosphate aldolase
MSIRQYLDSTYLKTALQAGISEADNLQIVMATIEEAIAENFKLVMVRPEMVAMARQMVQAENSPVCVGTVIDFPGGQSTLHEKLAEAEKAIADGADELDFVVNYRAFQNGQIDFVKAEVLYGTQLGLSHMKTVKWIIEVAALTEEEIAKLSALVKNVVVTNFTGHYNEVFVKSSTGFYKTEDGKPNGATVQAVKIMLDNAAPLPVKAAGGVRSFAEAMEMINLGVKRIGTSSAKAIAHDMAAKNGY